VFGITISLYIRGQFKKPEFFVYDLQTKLLCAEKVLDINMKDILYGSSADGGEKNNREVIRLTSDPVCSCRNTNRHNNYSPQGREGLEENRTYCLNWQ
jgi:hypothetical protein